jgi:hypothetical protein
MALLHVATLTPTKLDLLEGWARDQVWFTGQGPLRQVGNFRFDDPLGGVGVETLLVRAGDGPVMQVPLTYRAEALEGASLVGTTDHSVLGRRWVYDGPSDPVYRETLAATVLGGGTQVEMWIDEGKGLVQRTPNTTVVGSGTPGTVVPAVDALEINVIRVPAATVEPKGETLIGRWDGAEGMLLATISVR